MVYVSGFRFRNHMENYESKACKAGIQNSKRNEV